MAPDGRISWLTRWNVSRLNTKLEARELEVKDLVADLSDGVSLFFASGFEWLENVACFYFLCLVD
jgi:hypothetical protein